MLIEGLIRGRYCFRDWDIEKDVVLDVASAEGGLLITCYVIF